MGLGFIQKREIKQEDVSSYMSFLPFVEDFLISIRGKGTPEEQLQSIFDKFPGGICEYENVNQLSSENKKLYFDWFGLAK